jgi:hypothetical protein
VINIPIGKWPDFKSCVDEIKQRRNPRTGKPYGEEVAAKICATIEQKSESELKEMEKE